MGAREPNAVGRLSEPKEKAMIKRSFRLMVLLYVVGMATTARGQTSSSPPDKLDAQDVSIHQRLEALELATQAQEDAIFDMKKATKKNMFDRILPILTFLAGFLLSQLQKLNSIRPLCF